MTQFFSITSSAKHTYPLKQIQHLVSDSDHTIRVNTEKFTLPNAINGFVIKTSCNTAILTVLTASGDKVGNSIFEMLGNLN